MKAAVNDGLPKSHKGGFMKRIMILLQLLIVLPLGSAYAGKCTDWQKQDGTSCTLANESADVYKRQCENNCWKGRHGRGNWGPDCDQERLCSVEHPSTFKGLCSKWYKQSGTRCYNPNTQDWETKWERACTVGLKETWCSEDYPDTEE